jgi:hypothetical protein
MKACDIPQASRSNNNLAGMQGDRLMFALSLQYWFHGKPMATIQQLAAGDFSSARRRLRLFSSADACGLPLNEVSC